MSRKITQAAVSAFLKGESFKSSNTRISANASGIVIMSLHGNEIPRKNWNGDSSIEVSNAGWESNTTKERLNGIPGVEIKAKNFQWFLNGNKWDGKWCKI